MKVLFITKPFVIEPLGIMYLSSAVQPEHQVDIVTTEENIEYKIKQYQPDILAYSIMTGDQEFYNNINIDIQRTHSIFSIAGGPHPTFFPEMLEKASFNAICIGEGEQSLLYFLDNINNKSHIFPGFRRRTELGISECEKMFPLLDIDSIKYPDRKMMYKYDKINNGPIKHFMASRGCLFNCLSGDTIIHTTEGDKTIKELEGEKNIDLFTMDPKTEEVFITKAIHCRKTRENAKMVRVNFDDGTHIDCTPDHKFLVFKNRNQFTEIKRWEVKAEDLNPGTRVHALRFNKTPQGYIEVRWGRKKKKKLHRIIYEYYTNTKLCKNEHIHHKDKNKENNHINNLLKVHPSKHIRLFHPEIRDRMIKDNPSKYWTNESKKKLSISITGRKATPETKAKQSKNQTGEKNSNYRKDLDNNKIIELRKYGYSMKKIAKILNTNAATIWHRLKKNNTINHKVVSVVPIDNADVYDLEVPATHWFFANNVLVHNCTYCFNQAWANIYKNDKRVRFRSVDNILQEIKETIAISPTKFVYFQDDIFILNKNFVYEFASKYPKEIGLPFHCHTRANLVTKEIVEQLKAAGCYSVHIAAEAGSDFVRRTILNRKMSNEQIKNAVRLFEEHNIRTMLQNMIGLPFTFLGDDLDTLELNIECAPSYSWCSIYQPYPKTELGNKCIEEHLYEGDFSDISNSFFDKSSLNIPHANQVANLQKLFAIAVEYPGIYKSGLLRQLIELPHDRIKNILTKLYKDFRKVSDKRLYGMEL